MNITIDNNTLELIKHICSGIVIIAILLFFYKLIKD